MAVQTLELQISDNAAQAASNVNKLASAMQRLQNAVQLGGIKELVSRLQQISGMTGAGAISQMAGSISNATKQMESFTAALEKAISAMAGLRSRGGSAALDKVADEAKRASDAMQDVVVKDGPLGGAVNMESTTEQISEVQTAAEGATGAVAQLGQAIESVPKGPVPVTTIPAPEVRHVTASLVDGKTAAEHLLETVERVASSAPTAAEGLRRTLDVAPAVDHSTEAVHELRDALSHLRDQSVMVKSELQEMMAAEGPTSMFAPGTTDEMLEMEGVTQALSSATGELEHQTGMASSEVKLFASTIEMGIQKLESLKAAAVDAPMPIRALGASFGVLRDAVGGMVSRLGGLLKSFMRIAKFRLFRAVIRAITTAFKEGMENVREYSKAINGLYAQDMVKFDNAVLKMKNSLGASLAVAFQALLPLIHAVINALIDLANIFNQLVAMFSGHATWTKAVDVAASDFEKTKKNATGAAKAAKNLLAAWDELNVIQSQSGGGGGGGSGLDTTDYTKMFEEAEFAPWVQWIKDHLTEIKSLAIGIGAAFLAWKIASSLGLTLGTILQVAIGIGLAVAGIAEAWQGISDQIENGVNWDNLAKSVGGVALAVAGLWLAFGATAGAVAMLAGGIALAIAPMKELIETGTLTDESMTQLSIAIGLVGVAISLLTGSWIPLLVAGITIAVGWIVQKWDSIKEWAAGVWQSVSEWVSNAWKDVTTWLSDLGVKITLWALGVWISFSAWLAGVWQSVSTWFSEKWAVVSEWVSNAWADVTNWLNDLWLKIVAWAAGVWLSVTVWFSGLWTSITTWWSTTVQPKLNVITTWIDENVTQKIAGFFKTMNENIQSFVDDPIGSIKTAWQGMVEWFANTITIPIANFFIDCINGIISAINLVINYMNNLNFTIPGVTVGGVQLWDTITVGISGIQTIELIPRLEEIHFETDEASGTVAVGNGNNPGRSRSIVGAGSVGGGVNSNGFVGPTYYPPRNMPSYEGLVVTDDSKVDEQTSVIRQIEGIVQQIKNKPLNVVISPSAGLGRVVTESQEQWSRSTGGRTWINTTTPLEY